MEEPDPTPVAPFVALVPFGASVPSLDGSTLKTLVAVLQFHARFTTLLESSLARSGLSLARFLILVTLEQSGSEGVTPAQLASAIAVSRATMTGLLDTLQKQGLAHRRRDPADGRSFQVLLSTEGAKLLRRAADEHLPEIAQWLGQLSKKERRTLRTLLESFLHAPREPSPPR